MKNSSARPRDDGRAARRVVAHHAVGPADWLADEVAIDFPSLDEAVERMREAFLAPLSEGDALPELSAELRLSAHEAFEGVMVPLDLPIRKVCAACGGRGEIWSEPCERCRGVGQDLARHPVRLIVPPRVHDGQRFCLSVSFPSSSATRIEVRIAIK